MLQTTLFDIQHTHKWVKDQIISTPDVNLPISYKDKKVLSRYGDNIWDLSPYAIQKTTVISFERVSEYHIEEYRRLVYLLLLLQNSNRKTTHTGLAPSTLRIYSSYLYYISIYALKHKLSLKDFFASETLITNYIKEMVTTSSAAKLTRIILNKIKGMNIYESGIECVYKEYHNELLTEIEKSSEIKQTPFIPPRLYIEIINELWNEFEFLSEHKKAIISFYSRMQNEFGFAHSLNKGYSSVDITTGWHEAVVDTKISTVFERYDVKNRDNAVYLISLIQDHCKLLIHAYTGMRLMEVYNLKGACLIMKDDSYLIKGITSKTYKKIIETYWVTSFAIVKIIEFLKTLNKIVAKSHNVDVDTIPLFPTSLLFNPLNKLDNHKNPLSIKNRGSSHKNIKHLSSNNFIIQEEDMVLLKEVMYHRDWDNDEEFKVGKPWPIKTHQFRRTLVIFANRSGIVEFGALKRQLKHTNLDMTLYYGNGAGASKELGEMLATNDIAYESAKERPLLECLSFMRTIKDGTMSHGGIGKFASANPIVFTSVDETLKQFKNGELRYKDTPLGGCTSSEECNEKLHHSLVACLGCESSVIKTKKLKKATIKHEVLINKMQENQQSFAPQLNSLKEDFEIMNKALNYYEKLGVEHE